MPLRKLIQLKQRLCLVSDLDWTMVNHNDTTHESLLQFNQLWLTNFAQDSLLVFSTGRSPQLFDKLAGEVPLLTPDILVCSVGTEILINGIPDIEWESYLNEGWDRDAAAAVGSRFPELILQEISEQRPHKVSYKLYAADENQAASVINNLRSQLSSAGLDVNVIFSGGEDVDVLPSRASKGKALSFVLQQIEKLAGGSALQGGILVCGDSGNDVELFAVPGVHGCVVSNAHAELKEWCEANGHEKIFEATREGPAGIQQALKHFGMIPALPSLEDDSTVSRRQAVVGLHRWFESWFNAVSPDEGPVDISFLDDAFDENLEVVGPSGSVTTRADLLNWMVEKGRGSKAMTQQQSGLGALADQLSPLASPLSQALEEGGSGAIPSSATTTPLSALSTGGVNNPFNSGNPTPKAGAAGNMVPLPGKFRIWIDNYSEKEVAEGLWIVRYVELQQRFGANGSGSGGRTQRISSALLRRDSGSKTGYRWMYVHETWLHSA